MFPEYYRFNRPAASGKPGRRGRFHRSAADHPRQLLFAWQAGVDDTLVRPYHEAELRHAVNGVVGRAEEQRDAYRAAQIRRLSRPDYQHTQGGE